MTEACTMTLTTAMQKMSSTNLIESTSEVTKCTQNKRKGSKVVSIVYESSPCHHFPYCNSIPSLAMAFQFPMASGRKKKVQVFECPQETWKERRPRVTKVCTNSTLHVDM